MTTFEPNDSLGTAGRLGSDGGQWRSLEPLQLMAHIERTHHAYLRAALPRLTRLADRALDLVGSECPSLLMVEATVAELRVDVEPHIVKEERVLFPMIRELMHAERLPEFHCGTVLNPISAMMREHDGTFELLAKLRYHADDFTAPSDHPAACELYAALAELEYDTLLHMDKENNALFPAVMRREQELSRR